jgi:hypothetical protein
MGACSRQTVTNRYCATAASLLSLSPIETMVTAG